MVMHKKKKKKIMMRNTSAHSICSNPLLLLRFSHQNKKTRLI